MYRTARFLILAVALVAAITVGTSLAAPANKGYAVTCFPASHWGPANDEDRPCTVVGTPQEDGSTYVVQQTAGDEVGICYLPNPYEERGHYVAQCHRLPSIYAPGGVRAH